jgi:methylmalonyl-CoA/ethylmalonyl-CoA epimerase
MASEWKIDHVGYIVRDIEKAVNFYKDFGMKVTTPSAKVPDGSIAAFLQFGGMTFELFQPGDNNSVQGKFLAEHGEGINHISYIVHDLEKEKVEVSANGFPALFTIDVPQGSPPFKFTLFDTSLHGNLMMELSQYTK